MVKIEADRVLAFLGCLVLLYTLIAGPPAKAQRTDPCRDIYNRAVTAAPGQWMQGYATLYIACREAYK